MTLLDYLWATYLFSLIFIEAFLLALHQHDEGDRSPARWRKRLADFRRLADLRVKTRVFCVLGALYVTGAQLIKPVWLTWLALLVVPAALGVAGGWRVAENGRGSVD